MLRPTASIVRAKLSLDAHPTSRAVPRSRVRIDRYLHSRTTVSRIDMSNNRERLTLTRTASAADNHALGEKKRTTSCGSAERLCRLMVSLLRIQISLSSR